MISKWSYNLLKKEFELPSFRVKEELEKSIDESQKQMSDIQEKISSLQDELDDVLQRMGNITDFNELNTLRYDADRIAGELKDQQQDLEYARSDLQSSEKKLRSNALLFVWIDQPDNNIIDQIMLMLFTVAFLTASLIALKMKDRQLKLL